VPFDVLTLNTWGKPGPLGTNLKTRFGLIGRAVQGHDLVGLQETFTAHAAELEHTAGYPTFLRPKNGGFLKTNCGLTLLAKHPAVASDFAEFKQAAAGDALARKGVLFERLQVPGVGPVDVYVTHFQAKAGEKYEAIRLHDATVLTDFVKFHQQGNPTFILGDFNAKPGSGAYTYLLEHLPLRDAFATAHPDQPGYTADHRNPYRKPTSSDKRIDFILVMDGDRHAVQIDDARVVLDQPVGGVVLSDHYGVNGRFTIRGR
jgi:endonuclease/exonuclease/phosphatase family metal-dependent hydrolase